MSPKNRSSHQVEFDETFDIVVVGTGAAGFATALGAIDENLSALMIEGNE